MPSKLAYVFLAVMAIAAPRPAAAMVCSSYDNEAECGGCVDSGLCTWKSFTRETASGTDRRSLRAKIEPAKTEPEGECIADPDGCGDNGGDFAFITIVAECPETLNEIDPNSACPSDLTGQTCDYPTEGFAECDSESIWRVALYGDLPPLDDDDDDDDDGVKGCPKKAPEPNSACGKSEGKVCQYPSEYSFAECDNGIWLVAVEGGQLPPGDDDDDDDEEKDACNGKNWKACGAGPNCVWDKTKKPKDARCFTATYTILPAKNDGDVECDGKKWKACGLASPDCAWSKTSKKCESASATTPVTVSCNGKKWKACKEANEDCAWSKTSKTCEAAGATTPVTPVSCNGKKWKACSNASPDCAWSKTSKTCEAAGEAPAGVVCTGMKQKKCKENKEVCRWNGKKKRCANK